MHELSGRDAAGMLEWMPNITYHCMHGSMLPMPMSMYQSMYEFADHPTKCLLAKSMPWWPSRNVH
jgi:hypothetical protein